MPKNAFEPGAVVRVELDDGWHTYARMLARNPKVAFYDCRVSEPVEDVRSVLDRPVLFVLAVNNNAFRRWPIVGRFGVDVAPVPIPDQFLQDFDGGACEIINEASELRSATPEECLGLERAAVWRPESVEERLRDHYAGRTNPQVEHFKVNV
jgi:hypothetical protein